MVTGYNICPRCNKKYSPKNEFKDPEGKYPVVCRRCYYDITEKKRLPDISKRIEWVITQKKFRNKKTGEIKTQIDIFELDDYEEIKE